MSVRIKGRDVDSVEVEGATVLVSGRRAKVRIRRVRGSTSAAGLVRLANNLETTAGEVPQASDTRLLLALVNL